MTQRKARQIVVNRITFKERYNKCGKENCSKCPHGPYWYRLVAVVDGKQIWKYHGKERPDEQTAGEPDLFQEEGHEKKN